MQMEYHNIKTIEESVNSRNSRLWAKMNDNSRSEAHRNKFVEEHGGFFYRQGRYWTWKSKTEVQNGYWLKRVDTDEKVFFSSMTQFAMANGLTAVKICELLNGKRKTYKGWTAVELRAVKSEPGSHTKVKAPVKKKVGVPKQATFIHMETNQIIVVDNIKQYAKQNGMDPAQLYKVSTGKIKSCQKLRLFNPLEQYRPSKDT
jgi:hypothetical protein